MAIGQCKLCVQGSKALQKSHIIPEFLYNSIYDQTHKFSERDSATGTRQHQKGIRERLLCQGCETKLGLFETYFAGIWYKYDPLPNPVHVSRVERIGFDFERFYRFHLSILWKASVSQLRYFSAVKLGPFEEPLRQFLYGEAASLKPEPSVHGMILRDPQTHELWNSLIAPIKLENGMTVYTFVFGGCSWYYCAEGNYPAFDSMRLKRPGTMSMPVIPYTMEGSIIRALEASA